MRRSCRPSTAVMRTWQSGWHVSTARAPATISPPSSPARCVHCRSDWLDRWRRASTVPAWGEHAGPHLTARGGEVMATVAIYDVYVGNAMWETFAGYDAPDFLGG